MLALQRKRTVDDLSSDLQATNSKLAATKLELDVLKEEWQQMHQRVQEAEQKVASVEARNVFLEKSDEARRIIHNELRETQRRLVETRDENKRAQEAQATRQLDLEQQVHDLRSIQDEVGHLLRSERAEKEKLAETHESAKITTTQAIERTQ